MFGVTNEMILRVCQRHGWWPTTITTTRALKTVDSAAVSKAASRHDPDRREDAALGLIEDQLISAEIITGPKLFGVPTPDDSPSASDAERQTAGA